MDTIAPAETKLSSRDSVAQHLRFYKSKHRTKGCKITHMIGIPMIAIGWMCLPFSRKAFLQLHTGGWILQFIGHYVFEHNKPVILEVRDPKTVVSALIFTCEEWRRLLDGEEL
ncbi:MAG: DUF962 domain-containing protein [Candidatus Melainabacteria bacterium]|nr:DUF962 domain-containing protein [Candidatus Melainabacteria bacterium]